MPGGHGGFRRRKRRSSFPRRVILQFLQDNGDRHFSAMAIYENLSNDGISIGIASVYRNLEVLCEMGLVRRHNFGKGEAVYQYSESAGAHCHLILPDTVLDMEIDAEFTDTLKKFKSMLEEKTQTRIINIELNFFAQKRVRNANDE